MDAWIIYGQKQARFLKSYMFQMTTKIYFFQENKLIIPLLPNTGLQFKIGHLINIRQGIGGCKYEAVISRLFS